MLDLQRSNLKWRDLGRNVEILEESSKELAIRPQSINSGKQNSESMLSEHKASDANHNPSLTTGFSGKPLAKPSDMQRIRQKHN